MLEKLADALAAADDWPAAHDSLAQLRKTGMLSKRAQQLLCKLSEQDPADHAAQADVEIPDCPAGGFKRRRVEHATRVSEEANAAAELHLPTSPWAQLLSFLIRQMQLHLAGSQSSSYNFHLSTQPGGAAVDEPEEAIDAPHPSFLESTGLTGERSSSMRPGSASDLPSGFEEELVQRGAETGSQDCAERISKRIASRRYEQRAAHWISMPTCKSTTMLPIQSAGDAKLTRFRTCLQS